MEYLGTIIYSKALDKQIFANKIENTYLYIKSEIFSIVSLVFKKGSIEPSQKDIENYQYHSMFQYIPKSWYIIFLFFNCNFFNNALNTLEP